jgi:hypothetical protein
MMGLVGVLFVFGCAFTAGFGFGWCFRGDRARDRERYLEWELARIYDRDHKRVKRERRRSVEEKGAYRWN